MKQHLFRGSTWLAAGLAIGVVGALTFLNEPVVGRSTAMSADRILLAVGKIAANHEALYMFDQVTGDLTCYELRWKRQQVDFRGAKRNCLRDLDLTEQHLGKTKFAMVTGQYDRNSDAVFIGESNRGRIVAYVFDGYKKGPELAGKSTLARGERGGRR